MSSIRLIHGGMYNGNIDIDQVQEIEALGERYGFKLAGFRSFERAVTDTEIERVRQAARRRLSN